MIEKDFTERYVKLKKMRFSGMAEELKAQFEDPAISKLSPEERIFRLIDAESEVRDSKKFAKLVRESNVRYPNASINLKVLNAPGVDRSLIDRLSLCQWIDDGKDLLITGKTGAGKSYCACALACAAMSKFRTVKYYKASRLLRELQNAEDNQTMTDTLNKLAKYDLLIIDDFGLMRLEIERCRNLFELIDAREGRKSTIVISQFPVANWYEMFQDSTYADACLDRLTGSSYRLEFNGESLRKNTEGEG